VKKGGVEAERFMIVIRVRLYKRIGPNDRVTSLVRFGLAKVEG
jgi:hypothetical protein